MDKNTITISHLPSPTWVRLGVNGDEIDADIFKKAAAGKTNANVADRKIISQKQADELIYSHTGEIVREKYVAGKSPIYNEQYLATGLGKDFENAIGGACPDIELYTIENGKSHSSPIILTADITDDFTVYRQIIHAKKGVCATVILLSESPKTGKGAVETRVICEEGSSIRLIKIGLWGAETEIYDDNGAYLEKDSSFVFSQLLLGGGNVHTGQYADLRGDNSRFVIGSGYFISGESKTDINYIATHRGKNTHSKIYSGGALKDNAVKVFKGTIDFRDGSANSEGDEQEDVLLLSENVINKSVPVILSEEETVDGRHGATIGNLSEDILFYLASRGIDKTSAEMLFTRGKLMTITKSIPDKSIKEKISTYILEAFEANE